MASNQKSKTRPCNRLDCFHPVANCAGLKRSGIAALTVLENINTRATRRIAADPPYSRGTGGADQDQILQGFEFDIVPWRGGRRLIRQCIVLPNQRMLE
jgi:hypothetical protein